MSEITILGPGAPRGAAKGAPALRAGLHFEARVERWLERRYNFHPQVMFHGPRGRFIPDGLLFAPDYSRLCVVEIKTQHSTEGCGQLLRYVEWLSQWFRRPVQGLLMCAHYRPELLGTLVPTIETITECRNFSWGIFTLGARDLPRVRGGAYGLDLAPLPLDSAVWSSGGAGDCSDRLRSSAIVAALPRTGRARADA